ncbi:hypothetical protein GYMLUDRAFT_225338 [Collybiopsis luxurians FD-317 M1]|uniref:Uncharacterized protein n=1 Tax=Collybiopsis luxurians FD-317 M1 TaxID=944289 RepID=A0A0D0CQ55_9AGAR|nr:hypothetical protein GYMLUDRAFT_225338 [Collybiopsis luxurians FD-317 M1]
MSLYLCVDCGGSKTAAVIISASTGKVIGRANGGPSNIAYLPVPAFIQTIRETVGEALKTCFNPPSVEPVSLPPPPPPPPSSSTSIDPTHPTLTSFSFAAAWFGISGADSPSIIASVLPDLSTLLRIPIESGRLVVANDAHLLAAPIRMYQSEGVTGAVTVIGGTGSIVVSFTTDSMTKDDLVQLGRVGGWGWILGDEGGGFSVGREAVRQILQQQDAHSVMASPPPEGSLRKSIKEYFGINDVMELLTEVYLSDPAPGTVETGEGVKAHKYMSREKRLSSLSPLVFAAAFPTTSESASQSESQSSSSSEPSTTPTGDPLALSVLRTCAEDLADQISVLVGPPTASKPKLLLPQDCVLCFGGSLVGLESYRAMVLDELADKGIQFRYVEFVDDCAKVGAEALRKRFEGV